VNRRIGRVCSSTDRMCADLLFVAVLKATIDLEPQPGHRYLVKEKVHRMTGPNTLSAFENHFGVLDRYAREVSYLRNSFFSANCS